MGASFPLGVVSILEGRVSRHLNLWGGAEIRMAALWEGARMGSEGPGLSAVGNWHPGRGK